LAATLVGLFQGGVVLAFAPLVLRVTALQMVQAIGALALAAAASGLLGLLVAARLRSVENFAGVINVVLFPLLFLSGALYPTAGMPPVFHAIARLNPVTYAVDLMRHALGQQGEFGTWEDAGALLAASGIAFLAAALLFDPEQRFVGRGPTGSAIEERPPASAG